MALINRDDFQLTNQIFFRREESGQPRERSYAWMWAAPEEVLNEIPTVSMSAGRKLDQVCGKVNDENCGFLVTLITPDWLIGNRDRVIFIS